MRKSVARQYPFVIVIVLSLFITAILVMLAHENRYLVELWLRPITDGQARLANDHAVIHTIGGPAYFDFRAELADPRTRVTSVTLRVRPEVGEKGYSQSVSLSERKIHGIVQLGSQETPLVRDENYSFLLQDQDGRSLLEGSIRAEVTRYEGADRLLVGLGILASVVQVLCACMAAFRELRRASGDDVATARGA
jgi:hypothetical protein